MTKISERDFKRFLEGYFKKLEFYEKAGPVIDRWMTILPPSQKLPSNRDEDIFP